MQSELTFFGPLKRREVHETNSEDGKFYVYTRYRTATAEDCNYKCVYCDTHEDVLGGREAMELDHFRPWQKGFGAAHKKKFEHLKNEPTNLVHSCSVCNGFKWSHWPTEDPDKPYDHEKGWIDPFDECRADFLNVISDGSVCPIKAPAEYTIKKLRLNRPLLKRLREQQILKIYLQRMIQTCQPKWESIVREKCGTDHAETASEALKLIAIIQELLPVSKPI